MTRFPNSNLHYNVLVLHDVEDFTATRRTHLDHLICFERYAPRKHNFLYHYIRYPVTDALRKIKFHIVILSTTALAFCRYYRPRWTYHEFKEIWYFLSEMDAIKIAFPQDDYHQTNDIDSLFDFWGVDIIYSVFPEYANLFYPTSRRSAEIKGVFTGYVDDLSIELLANYRKAFDKRDFDIVQRVTMHPAWGGSFSRIKGEMANCFRERCELRTELKADISTNPTEVLMGEDWMALLGNGRFALGSEGGVSLWDPDGMFLDKALEFMSSHPDADFAEIEAQCFPGEDGKWIFRAFSPRFFEYAIMACSPILVEGEYQGILEPWVHYVPVRRDFGNTDEALEATQDWPSAIRRIEACYETLIENYRFRYSEMATSVMEDIDELAAGRITGGQLSERRFQIMVADHFSQQAKLPPVIPLPQAPLTHEEESVATRFIGRLPGFLQNWSRRKIERLFGQTIFESVLVYKYINQRGDLDKV